MKLVHTGTKRYPHQCHMCDKSFDNSGLLNMHVSVHTGEKLYKCYICDKAFSYSRSLDRHMQHHTYLMCDKAFTASGELEKHTRVHTGENPYKCHVGEITEQCLATEEAADSCRLEFIEIVPLTRDGPCTTECDSGDWSAEVTQENILDNTGNTDILDI